MNKICIVEIKSGNHSVAELCKFANPLENEVTLFTTQSLIENIKNDLHDFKDNLNIIVKDNNTSFFSFIQLINKTCSNYKIDLLIINTVSRWEFVFLNCDCPVVAYFYSLNFWFLDIKSIGKILKNFFQINYLNLISWHPNRWHANPYFGFIIRKKILKKTNGIIVEYPPFKNLLKENYNVEKPIFFIPKRIYNDAKNHKRNDKMVFVIPGMVSGLRRDYDLVIDAFENISHKYKSKIKLIVLGRPIKKYGKRIINRLKNLNASGFETKFFTDFIPHDVFSSTLSNADFIIAPIRLNYYSGVIKEKFTYTKGTGTFPDMIRYGKPTIVPKNYNVHKKFDKCFLKYKNSSDLHKLIIELCDDIDKFDEITKRTVMVIEKYTLKYVQSKFKNMIDELTHK